MRVSGKLYLCSVCKKKKQLFLFYVYKSGKQKGNRVSSKCIECTKKEKAVYREKNREKIRQQRRDWEKKGNNQERERIRKKEWEQNHPEKKKELARQYRQKNKEKLAAIRAKYRASKNNRTPSWLTNQDLANIKSIYKACKKISEKTGVSHEVDHIIPLHGKRVSGLHVPSNLQVIPTYLNRSKRNTYDIT